MEPETVTQRGRAALTRLSEGALERLPEPLRIDAFERAVRAALPQAISPSARRGVVGPLPEFDAMRGRAAEVYRATFRPGSLPVTAGIALAYTLVRGLVRAGHAADDLLYPAWRAQPVDRPVFMFANARSGTTLLHRLMALDEERFAPVKLYETVFPSVALNAAFATIAAHDPAWLGHPARRVVDGLNALFFSGWKDIHPMGLDKHEEDEATFCMTMHTTTLGLLFPEVDRLEDLFWFDHLPAEVREPFLDFYEGTIKRHLFSAGGEKRLLNKNVFYAPRVRSIYGRFPDAVFIYLIRAPHQSIGSYLDMFHRAWAVHRKDVRKDGPEARALAEMAIRQYRYALELRKVIPASQFLVLRYDDIARDPGLTVERIYQHLGMQPSPAFQARLAEATAAQRSFRSEHKYALEDFGISAEWVHEQLRDVYEEFGFDAP